MKAFLGWCYHEPTKRTNKKNKKRAESIIMLPRFVIRLEQKRSTIGGTGLGNAFQTYWTSIVLHLNLVKHSHIGSPRPYGIETSPKRFNRLLHLWFLNFTKQNNTYKKKTCRGIVIRTTSFSIADFSASISSIVANLITTLQSSFLDKFSKQNYHHYPHK